MLGEKEVISYLDSLSNWGRWGKEDELGTVNFINPDKVKKSLALARDGISVTCARMIKSSPEPDLKTQALRKDTDNGEGRRAGLEYVGMVFHGSSITHLDSPAHYFWKGKMYNGRPADLVNSRDGAKANDVEVLRNGIVTRGVLLDIAAVKNKRWLDPGETVTVADLEVAEKLAGIKAEAGDVVLVRTGNYKRSLETKEFLEISKEPGLSAAVTPWLWKKEVSVIGSDTANSHKSNEYKNISNPFHVISLVSMGLWILDNANLEELAKTCQEKKQWEFLLVINPLRLKNVTGSPVNPIAVF